MEIFPLHPLFAELRSKGLRLGIAELLAAQEAIQLGLAGETAESLRNLLRMLWLGAREELALFDACFDRYLAATPIPEPKEKRNAVRPRSPSEMDSGAGMEEGLDGGAAPFPTEPEEAENVVPAADNPSTQLEESAEIQLSAGESTEAETTFHLVRHHDPSTPALIRRQWQKLQPEFPSYAHLELDLRATVRQIARQGYFDLPVLRPRLSSDLNLVLLQDLAEPMLPLSDFVQRWQESVRRSLRLTRFRKAWFRSAPGDPLWTDVHLRESLPLRLLWRDLVPERSLVVVVSDFGAADDSWDSMRILKCRNFSRLLRAKGYPQLWLNPMGSDYWQGNSAGKIAGMTGMRSMDRSGTRASLDWLAGQFGIRSSEGGQHEL